MSISKKSNSFSCEAFLAFTSQPAGGPINTPFSAVVTVQDTHGATITGYTGNVTISKASGTGTLSGTLTVAAVAGVATFSNLSIDTAGFFTLSAASTDPTTSTVLTAVTSSSFAVGLWTLTADSISGGDIFGMNFALGSISPTTYSGSTIQLLANQVSTSKLWIQIQGVHAQSFFTSITVNGTTLTSASATTFTNGTNSYWEWTGQAGVIPSIGSYTVAFA